ncbi:MAG TPA: HNH endonuclease [Coleofasciculaceae cyanobacterium]|jgi:5-methylcytosine-specific restriction endonuclease McrA
MARTRRQPSSLWQQTRTRIWNRDQGRCQGLYCQDCLPYSLPLKQAQIDHILELSNGGMNTDPNLRTLCRRCHCLRASIAHQGMIAAALRDGVIPPNWRSLVWEG